MNYQTTLPACCSVGFLYGFAYNLYIPNNQEIRSKSGHFLAIFRKDQKPAFDVVVREHTLVSAVAIPGGHGIPLAICVFKIGKKKK